MRKEIGCVGGLLSAALLLLLAASPAKAYVVVDVTFFGLSPDPVYIVAGDAVVWVDADGYGPYTIYGPWGSFDTDNGIIFYQPGEYDYYDDVGDSGTVYVTANIPPSVTITNPVNNAVLTAPATFTFEADASDPDSDGLSDVEFYVNAKLVDDVFSSPFSTSITNLAAGTHTLTAIAYDNVFATATNSVTITVAPLILTNPTVVSGQLLFRATGLTIGKTNVLETSTDLFSPASWIPVATNVATTNWSVFTNTVEADGRCFRLLQIP